MMLTILGETMRALHLYPRGGVYTNTSAGATHLAVNKSKFGRIGVYYAAKYYIHLKSRARVQCLAGYARVIQSVENMPINVSTFKLDGMQFDQLYPI